MVQRQLQRGAFIGLHGKTSRMGHTLCRWRLELCIQVGQIASIADLQNLEVRALITQPIQDGLGYVHLRTHSFQILGCVFAGSHHPDVVRAIRHGGQPYLHAHRCGVPQRYWQHACRHAAGVRIDAGRTAQIVDQLGTYFLAVEQQGSLLAARLSVGRQQSFEFDTLV